MESVFCLDDLIIERGEHDWTIVLSGNDIRIAHCSNKEDSSHFRSIQSAPLINICIQSEHFTSKEGKRERLGRNDALNMNHFRWERICLENVPNWSTSSWKHIGNVYIIAWEGGNLSLWSSEKLNEVEETFQMDYVTHRTLKRFQWWDSSALSSLINMHEKRSDDQMRQERRSKRKSFSHRSPPVSQSVIPMASRTKWSSANEVRPIIWSVANDHFLFIANINHLTSRWIFFVLLFIP